MGVVISIALQKGGTCKTTTALNLASILGYKHKKVLYIDMDSQCDSTYFSGVDDPDLTVFDVLGGGCTPDEAIQHCKYFDLLPGSPALAKIEMAEDVEPTMLRDAIQLIKDKYDFVVIDTPPALGRLSFNSLVASDYVIIPAEPRPGALKGLHRLHGTITSIQDQLNPSLKVAGILLVKYSNRTILNRDIKKMIEDYAQLMNTQVFTSTIREGIVIPESQTLRLPLVDYASHSKPLIDYRGFASELIKRIGG